MVVWPFIAVLGLAVRLSDRGPAFVGVPRMGRGGQVFTMWKLRSMRADNADGRANGVSLTSIDDNRITPIGTRLRAYYLDELPQLWNVVRGEMGLLGARPEAPEFVDLTDPRWKDRAAIANPLFGTTSFHAAALFETLGDDKARAWLAGLRGNGVRVVSSNGEVKLGSRKRLRTR